MGHRHYFYKVKKDDVEKIKLKTVEELEKDYGDDEGYIDMHELIKQEKVYGFGKLYWCDTAERIYKKGKPLFFKQETMDYFSDYVPFVVGKDGLLEAIKVYEDKTLKQYNNLLDEKIEDGETLEQRLVNDVKSKIGWIADGMADVDIDKKFSINKTWLYEYGVFELTHILKTINWEKDILLFYGW